MTKQDAAWEAGQEAAETLAPESGLLGGLDSGDYGKSMAAVMRRAATHPAGLAAANLRFASRVAQVGPAAVGRWLGLDVPPPVPVEKDKRFTDPAWEDNPAYFALRQSYLAALGLAEDVLATGRGGTADRLSDGKAEMATRLLFDALAPTNFLVTNPAEAWSPVRVTSSTTCCTTADGHSRSTRRLSTSARTSPLPRERSSSGTT
jgi:polyhydroxyalkanoate synthase